MINFRFIGLIILVLICSNGFGQLYPGIHWQNTIGGSNGDEFRTLLKLSDGNYILGGPSLSDSSSDKLQNSRGNYDYWIIKINTVGDIIWQQTFGGNNSDAIYSIIETIDERLIVGGYSWSDISGEKTYSCRDISDYWVLKLDNLGSIQWQKTFGGSNSDNFSSMICSVDGGYLLGGSSWSNISGEKAENSRGAFDF